MTVVERIQKQLEAGNHTSSVFVDLKNILLETLDYYGIKGLLKIGFVLT